GVDVSGRLRTFARYARYGSDRSTHRLGASRIVTRPQQGIPHAVDLGDSGVVTIQRASGNTQTYTIPWVKTGVPLMQIDPVATPQSADRAIKRNADDAADEALRGLQMSMDPHDQASLGQGSLSPIFALPQGFERRLGGRGVSLFP